MRARLLLDDVTAFASNAFPYSDCLPNHKLGGTLSLPGLVVGSVLPDLEIPFFFMVFWGKTQQNGSPQSLRRIYSWNNTCCGNHRMGLPHFDRQIVSR